MARETILTGYGPSNQWQNLIFDGDERKFEVWETKILGYVKLRKLKETLVGTDDVNNDKNETAFAELIQFLDERSLFISCYQRSQGQRQKGFPNFERILCWN